MIAFVIGGKKMNEVLKQLHARKSVRAYEDKIITPEEKNAIIEAGIQAPTAGNMMLYSVIDVTDQSIKDKLAISCDNQPFIAQASLVLVFLADYQRLYDMFTRSVEGEITKPNESDLLLAMADAMCAAQNMVVAAESMGIGSCYIGDIVENYEEVKELLSLPDYAAPVAMLVFGYPSEQQKARQKPSRFGMKYVVHENHYRHLSPQEQTTMIKESIVNETARELVTAESYSKRIYEVKFNSAFSAEMRRSMKEIMKNWK